MRAVPQPVVYLDHAATTPLGAAAKEAILAHLDLVGNPNSLHGPGRAAHRVVEESRERLAAALGVHPSEIVLTSGGTEADNLGLKGLWWEAVRTDPGRRRILLTGTEHHAVLDTVAWLARHEGAEPVWVPVDQDGVVDLGAWERELAADPTGFALATLMWANNEVGTVQPVAAAAELALRYGVPVHTDAVQGLGHVPVTPLAPGLASAAVTAHKLGGPVGVGALVLSRRHHPEPLLHGGGHEREVRSGTLDAVGVAAFAAAAESSVARLEQEAVRVAALRDQLVDGVLRAVPGARLNGPSAPGDTTSRLPGIAHFTFPGCEGDAILFMLDMVGVATSTGSACTAGVAGPSHVLLAMGRDEAAARSVQRFSLGASTTQADVDAVLAALPAAVAGASAAGLNADARRR